MVDNRHFDRNCLSQLALGFCVFLLWIHPGYCDPVARYGGEFMANGGGARSLAMGQAYSALSSDAWSLFWNPAGLALVNRRQVGVMHSERFEGVVNYDVITSAAPQPDGAVYAAGLIRLGVNGIPFTRTERPEQPLSDQNRVEVDRFVSYGDYALFVGKGESHGRWRWGVAPKLIFRNIGTGIRAYGLGVDVGIGGKPISALPVEAGVAVRDLFGTVVVWEQTGRKELILSTVRLGMAGVFELPLLEARISPSLDAVYRLENAGGSDAGSFQAGLEYLIRGVFALRVGDDNGRFSVGGGLNLRPVSIDYAMVSHDELGDTHYLSVAFAWGGSAKP